MGKALFSQVSVCQHWGGGIPSPYLHPLILLLVPCPFWEIPQCLVPGPFWGIPSSRWVPQSQDRTRNPLLGRTGLRYPLQVGQNWGTPPWQGQDWSCPPHIKTEVTSPWLRTGLGFHPEIEHQREYLVRSDGMPLAFTQEDFLVISFIFSMQVHPQYQGHCVI